MPTQKVQNQDSAKPICIAAAAPPIEKHQQSGTSHGMASPQLELRPRTADLVGEKIVTTSTAIRDPHQDKVMRKSNNTKVHLENSDNIEDFAKSLEKVQQDAGKAKRVNFEDVVAAATMLMLTRTELEAVEILKSTFVHEIDSNGEPASSIVDEDLQNQNQTSNLAYQNSGNQNLLPKKRKKIATAKVRENKEMRQAPETSVADRLSTGKPPDFECRFCKETNAPNCRNFASKCPNRPCKTCGGRHRLGRCKVTSVWARKKSACRYCKELGLNCGKFANKCPNRPCSDCGQRHRLGRCKRVGCKHCLEDHSAKDCPRKRQERNEMARKRRKLAKGKAVKSESEKTDSETLAQQFGLVLPSMDISPVELKREIVDSDQHNPQILPKAEVSPSVAPL